jgi:hypothetical protein
MATKDTPYNAQAMFTGANYFRHHRHGIAELVAFHKDYKPGRVYLEENKAHNRFPKIWYSAKPGAYVKFAEIFCKDHMCCVGINPRANALKNEHGFNRSAADEDIQQVTHFYLDIDFENNNPTPEQIADLRLALMKMEDFYLDQGFKVPTLNHSGNGYHIIHKLAPILVAEHPDIKQRQLYFKDQFKAGFEKDLSRLEAEIDNTLDLSRKIKIPGTKKPGHTRTSSLEYVNPNPDDTLRDHLLSLDVHPKDDIPLEIKAGQLPDRFAALLAQDKLAKDLWNGEGKTKGDTTRSGYDFSLIQVCLKHGITDLNDLYAILALRPDGAVKGSGKGEKYLRNTIANAIKS